MKNMPATGLAGLDHGTQSGNFGAFDDPASRHPLWAAKRREQALTLHKNRVGIGGQKRH